jgi:hypothetical protein
MWQIGGGSYGVHFFFEFKIILKKSDFSPFAFTLDTTLCFVHGFYFRKV